jgi:kinetochor protein Mis14/NSL1
MDTQHRKIELQSPSDLTYLTTQLRTAALRKLNLHLPPVSNSSEPDDLRRSVEDLVESFIASIISGMRSNISINGMDVVNTANRNEEGDRIDGGVGEEVEIEEFEGFDEKLRGRVGAMIARRDALVGKISGHRRETAERSAGEWRAQWEASIQQDNVVQDVMEVEEAEGMDVGMEREEEVRKMWERAVEGLGRLDKGLPETRARLERAGNVVGYLGEGK